MRLPDTLYPWHQLDNDQTDQQPARKKKRLTAPKRSKATSATVVHLSSHAESVEDSFELRHPEQKPEVLNTWLQGSVTSKSQQAGVNFVTEADNFVTETDNFVTKMDMPLWVALSTNGNNDLAEDMLAMMLSQYYHPAGGKYHIVRQPLKSNVGPSSKTSFALNWLSACNPAPNVLCFMDAHSDTNTGHLVIGGSRKIPLVAARLEQILDMFYGVSLRPLLRQLPKSTVRGAMLLSCGPAIRVPSGHQNLTALVDDGTFNFVLTPAGQTTINTMVVVAMMRFAEYVFVRNMTPWDALLYAFVRDNLALESTSVALIFQPPTQPGTPPTTETRVLARSTYTRLWGLDFYRCANPQCRKDMLQMQAQKQHKAPRWEANTYRLKCFACDHENRNIGIPSWVHPVPGEIQHRVWFNWPPTAEQLADIYAHPQDLAPWLGDEARKACS